MTYFERFDIKIPPNTPPGAGIGGLRVHVCNGIFDLKTLGRGVENYKRALFTVNHTGLPITEVVLVPVFQEHMGWRTAVSVSRRTNPAKHSGTWAFSCDLGFRAEKLYFAFPANFGGRKATDISLLLMT